jgi:hypothetical protein
MSRSGIPVAEGVRRAAHIGVSVNDGILILRCHMASYAKKCAPIRYDLERRLEAMAVKLNKIAFAHSKQLVNEGKVVIDEKDEWSEHQPSAEAENEFIRQHGFDEYGKWYLGIDDQEHEHTKGRYKFPYGDFERVHRCGVISAESRAGQYKYHEIESAAAHLHGMIENMKEHMKVNG